MRRLGVVALVGLLAGCGANETAQCSPCAGPGYAVSGVPAAVDHGVARVCVGDAPCTRTRFDHSLVPRSQEFLELPDDGRSWEDYEGTPVLVTVTSDGEQWQGTGDFDYTDGGGGTCSCSSLVAEVALTRVG